ncbi:pimeloyl-CoA dehydrogenase [Pseudacidovorax intermedius]|uniref:Pimeloyl-CoA dehydrogenase n=3 Tax=Pseudacidovorax intermedius TaxID=433924 RepID=A0A370FEC4_9BURK|nr:acyl-CoA dehydrogenase [Pseudacidovorax intermedius]RDI24391.1 pimeloyl-CoA dehydrogenase [Pseudacidovorax intermedius]
MNFELDDEQRALQDSLARLMAERYGFEQRRAHAASEGGHDPLTLQHLAELGVTALAVPSAHGGFDGGARALLPVMRALGGALCLEPLLPQVLAATALRLGADEALCAEQLPGLADGTTRMAWAHDETAGRHAPCWIETRATHRGGGWVLDGAKAHVLGADLARHVVVSARTGGAPDDSAGRALFLVDADAPGLQWRRYRLVDDTPAAELRLAGVPARPLVDPADGDAGGRAIDGVVAMGTALACADMLGAAETANRLAVDYLHTRKQFGRTIGENQALRHRVAEMRVDLEMARSMAMAAAVAVDLPDGDDAGLDLHRAKLCIGRHAREVAHGAIQLHGGIGMTEEYAVGHCLRRIHVMDQLFGDSGAHAARLASMLAA